MGILGVRGEQDIMTLKNLKRNYYFVTVKTRSTFLSFIRRSSKSTFVLKTLVGVCFDTLGTCSPSSNTLGSLRVLDLSSKTLTFGCGGHRPSD